jgi:hypothetical protein
VVGEEPVVVGEEPVVVGEEPVVVDDELIVVGVDEGTDVVGDVVEVGSIVVGGADDWV